MAKKNPADFIIIFSVILLTCIGVIMVFSASQYSAGIKLKDDFYYLKSQIRWALLGFIAMAIMSKFPYKKIQKMSNLIFIICLFLLAIKFIPGIGINRGGATRWIGIGSRYTIQPSELTKIGLIIFMANSLSKRRKKLEPLPKE